MTQEKEITPEQKNGLLKGLIDKGLNTDNIMKSVVATSQQSYLTDIPGFDSLIPVHKLAVHKLADLKKFSGNSDDDYKSGKMEVHLDENLPEWDQAKNDLTPEELSVEENKNIVKALKTYVYGYSDKVKSYETVIHNHHFPLTVATYTAEDITVKSGTVLNVTGSSSVHDYGKVTVEAGGRINFETNAVWTVQEFISE